LTIKTIFRILPFSILLFFNAATAAEWNENKEVAQIFKDAGVTGTFVLYDVSRDEYTGFDQQRANTRYIPASTYKIANSLIGLTTGAVKDVDEILPYGGGEYFMDTWEHDMSLRDAIVISNVPIYQELARRIGLEKMRENMRKLNYGNMDIGQEVDQFWLEGPLEISAVEQTKFVSELAQQKLDFPIKHQKAVAEILELENGDGWSLHAKTGWQTATDPGIGWWVGWVKRGDHIYAFALNLDMYQIVDAPKRIELGKAALKALNVLTTDNFRNYSLGETFRPTRYDEYNN
jgi:beta-lactamase class D